MRMLALPEVLDLNAASPLAAELLAARGAPLVIDAAAARHLGGQCLQVLLSALATWRTDGLPLLLRDPAGRFGALVAGFGHNLSLPLEEA